MLPLEHSAIHLTFIKLQFVIKIFVLSILEWPFYTGFTVYLLDLFVSGCSLASQALGLVGLLFCGFMSRTMGWGGGGGGVGGGGKVTSNYFTV